MEVSATAKYLRVQPRKVRIIADEIRGKHAGQAAALLGHHTSKGAKLLRKVLISAMANAAENHGLAPETLKVAAIQVNQGPVLKRMTAKAMGRGARILKKTSHITVVVEDVEPTEAVRPHGAKAKARPTFSSRPAKGGTRPTAGGTPTETVPPPVDEPSTTQPEPAPVQEPETVPGTIDAAATDATAAQQDGAASEPVASEPAEATPVEASEAPEEGGGENPTATPAPKAEAADEENNA